MNRIHPANPPRALLIGAAMAFGLGACQASSGSSPFGFGNEASMTPSGSGGSSGSGSGGGGSSGSGFGGLPGGVNPIAPDRADAGGAAGGNSGQSGEGPPSTEPEGGMAAFKFCHILTASEPSTPIELKVGPITLAIENGSCAPQAGADCPTIPAGTHTLELLNRGNRLASAQFTFESGKEYVFVPGADSATRSFKFLYDEVGVVKSQATCASLEWNDLQAYINPAPDAGSGAADASAPPADASAPPADGSAPPTDAGPPPAGDGGAPSAVDTAAPPAPPSPPGGT